MSSNTVTATVPVGSGPFGVAINASGTNVYVANWDSNDVSVIDTATNTVIATVPVGKEPKGVAVTPDGTKVYVTNTNSSTVSVIDTATNIVIANVSVGIYPLGVAVSPDGNKAYVTNYGSGNVSVINTANNTVTTTISVGSIPSGIIVNSAGTKAYVANHGSNTVSVINTTTDTVIATVPVGSGPFGVAVNLAGSKAYVTNSVSNTVSVIDTSTNTVIATIPVGSIPSGIAANPSKKVYVVNHGSNTVSVINTITNSITATIPVGSGPTAFGQFVVSPPVPAGANLCLYKQAPVNSDQGSLITYKLHYHNFGNKDAQNVVIEDVLSDSVEFESASNGGVYDPVTRTVTWDVGSVAPEGHGYRTLTVRIPQSVAINTVILNDASISTSDPETEYDDNEAHTQTKVTTGYISVYYGTPTTFSYLSCTNATAVDIRIHINDGGPDIIGNMAGGPPDWSYTITFYPRYGRATVTYTVHGCNGGNESQNLNIYIDPAGYIYDIDTGERIANASVWLQASDGIGGWENVSTGESVPVAQPDVNPQITDEDGMYQWDVLNGSYRVHVEAPGYEPANSIVVSIPPPVTDLHVGLVRIPVPLAANFNTNVTSGYAPLSVQFTDISSNVTEWNWDFGDGTNSTEQNPTHTYLAAGNYTVNLTVSNGNDTDSKLATITVLEPVPPASNVSSNATNVYAPVNVQIGNLSQNATRINWNIGSQLTGVNASSNGTNVSAPVNVQIGNLSQNATTINWNIRSQLFGTNFSNNGINISVPVTVQVDNLSQNATTINWNI